MYRSARANRAQRATGVTSDDYESRWFELAAWDPFTIGTYRDLKIFAESADIPEDREEAASRKAGFQSAGDIGLYLRTLIAEHHDTLAVSIR